MAPSVPRHVDLRGWTGAEFLELLAAPSPRSGWRPAPRIGSRATLMANSRAGVLPTEAVVLARAITDTAPRAGRPTSPAQVELLERYLPESLQAYELSSARGANPAAIDLLLTQLRLLHQVAWNIEQAEAEHNERDLRIQEGFLKERFSTLEPSGLDLPSPIRSMPPVRRLEVASPGRASDPRVEPGRAYLRADVDPVVLFAREPAATWDLTLRLALPRGLSATVGVVIEASSGATRFIHKATRRLLPVRRPTGFTGTQIDVLVPLTFTNARRFLIYGLTRLGRVPVPPRAPTDTVLFVGTGRLNQAEVATLLTNHRRAPVTVIASGYLTDDGLVLRNESTMFPDLRTACEDYGYWNTSWLDLNTPVV